MSGFHKWFFKCYIFKFLSHMNILKTVLNKNSKLVSWQLYYRHN